MSFLAQLRQQSATPSHRLGLCYVLTLDELDAVTCSASLQLHLAEFEQDQFCRRVDDYQPQPAHISSPPPFLSAADIGILQMLDEANSNTLDWLGPVVGSGHCFIDNGSDSWLPVRHFNRQDLSADLCWQVTAYGEQQLQWRPEYSGQCFWLSQDVFIYDLETRCLSPLRCDFNADAFPLLEQWQRIPPSQLTTFASDRQRWSELALPAPGELERVEASVRITPVLLFASRQQDTITLTFRYCSDGVCTRFDVHSHDDLYFWDGAVLQQISRHYDVEQEAASCLESFLDGFKSTQSSVWHSDDIEHWHRLLGGSQAALREAGFELVMEAGFFYPALTPSTWKVDISEQLDGQWQLAIQLHCSIGASEQVIDLLPLLTRLDEQTVQTSNEYICLALEDGRQLLLPRRQVSLLHEELPDFSGASKHPELHFPASQLSRLQQLANALPEDSQWCDDDGLLARSAQLQHPPNNALSLAGLEATLRPYQQHGVCWLQHIKRQGCNGLLADDMGLGKTLQTIAHLWLEKRSGTLRHPALIVAPSSLLHNWAAELGRFAPELSVHCLQGSQRHDSWFSLGEQDILITSYALLNRDLERWRQQTLSWLILDEAQQIKNPATQISRAVRQIPCEHRLCLSGTPMENHLGELWSLFDFLMPGCLGSERSFKRYFRKPIEQQGDQARYMHLLKRLTPLMLRRAKNVVASELPPKTDILRSVPMDDQQAAFYQSLKQQCQSDLQTLVEHSDNENQQRIHALTMLLKLRQACCDPALLGETAPSAKRQHCMEIIVELIAEERAVLVFSQFTKMLDLLAEDLDSKAIPYLTLTGSTRNRAEQVTAFQAGKAPVFLISLKAGGTGLNLTRADTVIHYDPWWNDAAQQQASDRAHRIGQDKPVFVYKLIVEHSIEEKIAELQTHKARLGEHINAQAKLQSERFTMKLDEILALLNDE